MDRTEKIDREVEQTLAGLENIEPVQADSFFYTRLEARLSSIQDRGVRPPAGWSGLQALRPVFITLLLALNIMTGVWVYQHSRNQENYRQEYLEIFAEELGISQSTETESSNI